MSSYGYGSNSLTDPTDMGPAAQQLLDRPPTVLQVVADGLHDIVIEHVDDLRDFEAETTTDPLTGLTAHANVRWTEDGAAVVRLRAPGHAAQFGNSYNFMSTNDGPMRATYGNEDITVGRVILRVPSSTKVIATLDSVGRAATNLGPNRGTFHTRDARVVELSLKGGKGITDALLDGTTNSAQLTLDGAGAKTRGVVHALDMSLTNAELTADRDVYSMSGTATDSVIDTFGEVGVMEVDMDRSSTVAHHEVRSVSGMAVNGSHVEFYGHVNHAGLSANGSQVIYSQGANIATGSAINGSSIQFNGDVNIVNELAADETSSVTKNGVELGQPGFTGNVIQDALHHSGFTPADDFDDRWPFGDEGSPFGGVADADGDVVIGRRIYGDKIVGGRTFVNGVEQPRQVPQPLPTEATLAAFGFADGLSGLAAMVDGLTTGMGRRSQAAWTAGDAGRAAGAAGRAAGAAGRAAGAAGRAAGEAGRAAGAAGRAAGEAGRAAGATARDRAAAARDAAFAGRPVDRWGTSPTRGNRPAEYDLAEPAPASPASVGTDGVVWPDEITIVASDLDELIIEHVDPSSSPNLGAQVFSGPTGTRADITQSLDGRTINVRGPELPPGMRRLPNGGLEMNSGGDRITIGSVNIGSNYGALAVGNNSIATQVSDPYGNVTSFNSSSTDLGNPGRVVIRVPSHVKVNMKVTNTLNARAALNENRGDISIQSNSAEIRLTGESSEPIKLNSQEAKIRTSQTIQTITGNVGNLELNCNNTEIINEARADSVQFTGNVAQFANRTGVNNLELNTTDCYVETSKRVGTLSGTTSGDGEIQMKSAPSRDVMTRAASVAMVIDGREIPPGVPATAGRSQTWS